MEGFIDLHFHDQSRQAELWLTYAGLTTKEDTRHAKRRVAFSGTKQETVLAGFPFARQS